MVGLEGFNSETSDIISKAPYVRFIRVPLCLLPISLFFVSCHLAILRGECKQLNFIIHSFQYYSGIKYFLEDIPLQSPFMYLELIIFAKNVMQKHIDTCDFEFAKGAVNKSGGEKIVILKI